MCNRFNISTNPKTLGQILGAEMQREFSWEETVYPKTIAPTLAINREGQRVLLPMSFGLVPFGSDRATQKRPFTNARIESLNKWPWVRSVTSYRCVVPMLSFQEPCYWGVTAGSEVDFFRADGELLLAAAIYSWQESQLENAKESLSMSLIMRPAFDYVMQRGHHRSPLFINPRDVNKWCSRERISVPKSIDILHQIAFDPELDHKHFRDMSPSWKKRQEGKIKKRDEQLTAMFETD